MATHDLGEARRLAGEIVLLHRGRVIESGPAEAFFTAPAPRSTAIHRGGIAGLTLGKSEDSSCPHAAIHRCRRARRCRLTTAPAWRAGQIDRGRFDHVDPGFRPVRISAADLKRKTGITVKVIAQGTGQALDTGRRGDADVVFVHAKSAELKFLAEGEGLKRYPVMYNDFVLIGPKAIRPASRA